MSISCFCVLFDFVLFYFIIFIVFMVTPLGRSHRGTVVNESKNHAVVGSIPALAQWVNDPVLP